MPTCVSKTKMHIISRQISSKARNFGNTLIATKALSIGQSGGQFVDMSEKLPDRHFDRRDNGHNDRFNHDNGHINEQSSHHSGKIKPNWVHSMN